MHLFAETLNLGGYNDYGKMLRDQHRHLVKFFLMNKLIDNFLSGLKCVSTS